MKNERVLMWLILGLLFSFLIVMFIGVHQDNTIKKQKVLIRQLQSDCREHR